MRTTMFALGASLILAATAGAADAKYHQQNRGIDRFAPTWNGTSPPGFSQGNKSWRNATPPGWAKGKGKRRGWNDQSVPPGLYKRR
jgi:hypothetical protein